MKAYAELNYESKTNDMICEGTIITFFYQKHRITLAKQQLTMISDIRYSTSVFTHH